MNHPESSMQASSEHLTICPDSPYGLPTTTSQPANAEPSVSADHIQGASTAAPSALPCSESAAHPEPIDTSALPSLIAPEQTNSPPANSSTPPAPPVEPIHPARPVSSSLHVHPVSRQPDSPTADAAPLPATLPPAPTAAHPSSPPVAHALQQPDSPSMASAAMPQIPHPNPGNPRTFPGAPAAQSVLACLPINTPPMPETCQSPPDAAILSSLPAVASSPQPASLPVIMVPTQQTPHPMPLPPALPTSQPQAQVASPTPTTLPITVAPVQQTPQSMPAAQGIPSSAPAGPPINAALVHLTPQQLPVASVSNSPIAAPAAPTQPFNLPANLVHKQQTSELRPAAGVISALPLPPSVSTPQVGLPAGAAPASTAQTQATQMAYAPLLALPPASFSNPLTFSCPPVGSVTHAPLPVSSLHLTPTTHAPLPVSSLYPTPTTHAPLPVSSLPHASTTHAPLPVSSLPPTPTIHATLPVSSLPATSAAQTPLPTSTAPTVGTLKPSLVGRPSPLQVVPQPSIAPNFMPPGRTHTSILPSSWAGSGPKNSGAAAGYTASSTQACGTGQPAYIASAVQGIGGPATYVSSAMQGTGGPATYVSSAMPGTGGPATYVSSAMQGIGGPATYVSSAMQGIGGPATYVSSAMQGTEGPATYVSSVMQGSTAPGACVGTLRARSPAPTPLIIPSPTKSNTSSSQHTATQQPAMQSRTVHVQAGYPTNTHVSFSQSFAPQPLTPLTPSSHVSKPYDPKAPTTAPSLTTSPMLSPIVRNPTSAPPGNMPLTPPHQLPSPHTTVSNPPCQAPHTPSPIAQPFLTSTTPPSTLFTSNTSQPCITSTAQPSALFTSNTSQPPLASTAPPSTPFTSNTSQPFITSTVQPSAPFTSYTSQPFLTSTAVTSAPFTPYTSQPFLTSTTPPCTPLPANTSQPVPLPPRLSQPLPSPSISTPYSPSSGPIPVSQPRASLTPAAGPIPSRPGYPMMLLQPLTVQTSVGSSGPSVQQTTSAPSVVQNVLPGAGYTTAADGSVVQPGRPPAASSLMQGGNQINQAGGTTAAVQPRGVTTAGQPGPVTTAGQPGGVTTAAQPGAVTTVGQPGGVTTAGQHGGVTTAVQPGGVTTAVQPGGVTTAVQPQSTAAAETQTMQDASKAPAPAAPTGREASPFHSSPLRQAALAAAATGREDNPFHTNPLRQAALAAAATRREDNPFHTNPLRQAALAAAATREESPFNTTSLQHTVAPHLASSVASVRQPPSSAPVAALPHFSGPITPIKSSHSLTSLHPHPALPSLPASSSITAPSLTPIKSENNTTCGSSDTDSDSDADDDLLECDESLPNFNHGSEDGDNAHSPKHGSTGVSLPGGEGSEMQHGHETESVNERLERRRKSNRESARRMRQARAERMSKLQSELNALRSKKVHLLEQQMELQQDCEVAMHENQELWQHLMRLKMKPTVAQHAQQDGEGYEPRYPPSHAAHGFGAHERGSNEDDTIAFPGLKRPPSGRDFGPPGKRRMGTMGSMADIPHSAGYAHEGLHRSKSEGGIRPSTASGYAARHRPNLSLPGEHSMPDLPSPRMPHHAQPSPTGSVSCRPPDRSSNMASPFPPMSPLPATRKKDYGEASPAPKASFPPKSSFPRRSSPPSLPMEPTYSQYSQEYAEEQIDDVAQRAGGQIVHRTLITPKGAPHPTGSLSSLPDSTPATPSKPVAANRIVLPPSPFSRSPNQKDPTTSPRNPYHGTESAVNVTSSSPAPTPRRSPAPMRLKGSAPSSAGNVTSSSREMYSPQMAKAELPIPSFRSAPSSAHYPPRVPVSTRGQYYTDAPPYPVGRYPAEGSRPRSQALHRSNSVPSLRHAYSDPYMPRGEGGHGHLRPPTARMLELPPARYPHGDVETGEDYNYPPVHHSRSGSFPPPSRDAYYNHPPPRGHPSMVHSRSHASLQDYATVEHPPSPGRYSQHEDSAFPERSSGRRYDCSPHEEAFAALEQLEREVEHDIRRRLAPGPGHETLDAELHNAGNITFIDHGDAYAAHTGRDASYTLSRGTNGGSPSYRGPNMDRMHLTSDAGSPRHYLDQSAGPGHTQAAQMRHSRELSSEHLRHTSELHPEGLRHTSELHTEGLRHTSELHTEGLRHTSELHTEGLRHTSELHTEGLRHTNDRHQAGEASAHDNMGFSHHDHLHDAVVHADSAARPDALMDARGRDLFTADSPMDTLALGLVPETQPHLDNAGFDPAVFSSNQPPMGDMNNSFNGMPNMDHMDHVGHMRHVSEASNAPSNPPTGQQLVSKVGTGSASGGTGGTASPLVTLPSADDYIMHGEHPRAIDFPPLPSWDTPNLGTPDIGTGPLSSISPLGPESTPAHQASSLLAELATAADDKGCMTAQHARSPPGSISVQGLFPTGNYLASLEDLDMSQCEALLRDGEVEASEWQKLLGDDLLDLGN